MTVNFLQVDFFRKYIPTDVRIHIIGHSIGSYIALELLENSFINDRVSNAYLLFPTVEHMAMTAHGKFLNRYIRRIVWLIVILSWIFTVLPTLVQTVLLYIYMFITGIPPSENCENIRSLIKPAVLKRVFFLAFEELDQVKERNNKIIQKNLGKLKFYYGMNDEWAPGSFCDRLQSEIPNVNAQVCSHNHTFVLNRSTEVGNVVSDWIKGKP